jgi:hypothetical protein
MPAATLSRRKNSSRRQDSSDIEEDRPTQPGANEQVDDDDEDQPRRRTNGVKKEKKPGNSSRAAQPMGPNNNENFDEEDDEEDDDDGKVDIANFQDQPISRADLKKISGLSEDWDQMQKFIRQNWKVIGDAAVSMAEAAEGDEGEEVCHLNLYLFAFVSYFLGTRGVGCYHERPS